MDNQQPSTLEERVFFLAKNALFGDGSLWQHPTGRFRKLVYTSTTPELLEAKRQIAPEIFTAPISLVKKRSGTYPNAKPLYYMASRAHPVITDVHQMGKEELLPALTVADLGLWYLDDGCKVRSNGKDTGKFVICIGDTCSTPERMAIFVSSMESLFGGPCGAVRPNGSKATERNKVWWMRKAIAEQVLAEAGKYGVLQHKFPMREGSETIRKE